MNMQNVKRLLKKLQVSTPANQESLEDELKNYINPEDYGVESIQELLYDKEGSVGRRKLAKQAGVPLSIFDEISTVASGNQQKPSKPKVNKIKANGVSGRKITKAKLRALANTSMQKAVAESIIDGSDGDIATHIKDILYGGLESGTVSDMIYYEDTLKFFKKYKDEIKKLLKETMSEQGVKSPAELLFAKKWDDDDPFADDTTNQNLLAWFAFEETTRAFSDKLGLDN